MTYHERLFPMLHNESEGESERRISESEGESERYIITFGM